MLFSATFTFDKFSNLKNQEEEVLNYFDSLGYEGITINEVIEWGNGFYYIGSVSIYADNQADFIEKLKSSYKNDFFNEEFHVNWNGKDFYEDSELPKEIAFLNE